MTNPFLISREQQESLSRLDEINLARDGYRVEYPNPSSALAIGLPRSGVGAPGSTELFTNRTLELRDSLILKSSTYTGTTFRPPSLVILSTRSNTPPDETKALIYDSLPSTDWYKVAFVMCSDTAKLAAQLERFVYAHGLVIAKSLPKSFEGNDDITVSGGRIPTDNPMSFEPLKSALSKAGIYV